MDMLVVSMGLHQSEGPAPSSSKNHACSLPGQSRCNETSTVDMLNIAWRRLSWKAMYSASMLEVSISCL